MASVKNTAPQECANCGKPKVDHIVVNYSNGNIIFGDVFICPTAVFRELPPKGKKR